MLNVALYQPEIPPNTGNIIRLCANTKAHLHLIHPLGFEMSDKLLKRAGLDYHEFANIKEYQDYADFSDSLEGKRLIACSTKGERHYSDIQYTPEDMLLFGPETRGLPAEILDALPKSEVIRIPMAKESRSLNLSNAVAVILFEACRQLDFEFDSA